MPRKPLTDEQKKAMMERLKAGKAKTAAARADAKAKGLPDPKPRKPRSKKSDGAVKDPLAAPSNNDSIPGIQSAPETNKAAATTIAPAPTETKPIDVPNLPEDKKDIVQDAAKKPKARAKKAATNSAGAPAQIQQNQMLANEETGDMVIPVQYPDQKKSIEKALKKNKELRPVAPSSASQENMTVKKQVSHAVDKPAIQASAPFSFAAARKVLYQF
jgi:hypothetical protein